MVELDEARPEIQVFGHLVNLFQCGALRLPGPQDGIVTGQLTPHFAGGDAQPFQEDILVLQTVQKIFGRGFGRIGKAQVLNLIEHQILGDVVENGGVVEVEHRIGAAARVVTGRVDSVLFDQGAERLVHIFVPISAGHHACARGKQDTDGCQRQ